MMSATDRSFSERVVVFFAENQAVSTLFRPHGSTEGEILSLAKHYRKLVILNETETPFRRTPLFLSRRPPILLWPDTRDRSGLLPQPPSNRGGIPSDESINERNY